MNATDLPALNAALNATASILLLLGYRAIKQRNEVLHRMYMVGALIVSAAFLTSYLIYHYQVGSVPYPKHDWTRPLYFTILIPHVILAAIMTPFIILAVVHAVRGRFDKHARITRWLWPVWIFVSISGVVVYLMLYQM